MTWVNIGEWMPDTADFGVGKITALSNTIPNGEGYDPVLSFNPVSGPIIEEGKPAGIIGSKSFINTEGNVFTFAGTRTGLYMLESSNWENISKDGGYTSTATDWQFAMYGNLVIATNYVDPVQCIDLGKDIKFSDLSPTAPRARAVTVVNEFVVLGDTIDPTDGIRPNRVWWGPIADPKGDWTPNQSTMCDFQDVGQGTNLIALSGGDLGYVFMRSAVVRMTFVGSPTVFQFDVIDHTNGCVGINALTGIGSTIFFLSRNGFFQITNGSSVAIGLNKIDKLVLRKFPAEALRFSQCAVDYAQKCIWWTIPTVDEAEKVIMKSCVVYNYTCNKWGRVDTPLYYLHSFYSKGYTLEELDAINKSIDKLPFSLDSLMYKGGSTTLGCFDMEGRLCYGRGSQLPAFVVTGDVPMSEHQTRAWLNRVRLGIEGSSKEHKVAVAVKQTISDPVVYNRTASISRIGDYPFRASGRYHRLKIDLLGDWNQLVGYDVDVRKEGTQ